MGAYMKMSRGRDPNYPLKQIAKQVAATGASYYLQAVVEGGEPPGVWLGEGLAALGIHDGDEIDHDEFLSLYGEFKDRSTGEHLGHPPRGYAEFQRLLTAKLEAEQAKLPPGGKMSRDRKRELAADARHEVKNMGNMYFDAPFSVSKDISLMHATAMAMAKWSREHDDAAAAAMWQARAEGIVEEIMAGARTAVAYLQREATFVRVGHHGAKGPDGESTGRRLQGHDIPVAAFLQHLSRDGEMQLHVHLDWLNKIMGPDGKWYATDSRALYRHVGAATAAGRMRMHAGLSRRFGVEWEFRPESRDRVIKGTPDEAIRAFSSRSLEVTDLTARLAREFERKYGRPATQDEINNINRDAAKITKKGKAEGAIDFGRLLDDWAAKSRAAQLGSLKDLAPVFWGKADAGSAPAQMAAQTQLSEAQLRSVLATAVAEVQAANAKWQKCNLEHWIESALPDWFVLPADVDASRFLSELADRAIAGEGGEQVVCLSAPEFPRVPDSLRRPDGESVYHIHGSELYATASQMDMEARVVAMARTGGAPHLEPDVCAKLIGARETDLEAQLHEAAQNRGTDTGSGLRLDQAAATFHAMTSSRRTEIIAAAAGAGKTFTAGIMAKIWQEAGMGRVFGLATSSAARDELADAGVPNCFNFAQFLGHTKEQREALPKPHVEPGDLFLVDEGTVADLPNFDAFQRYVHARGAKAVMFVGDNQAGAVENVDAAGIIMRSGQYARMREPVRFAPGWQRDASLAIHAGDPAGLQAYAEHGRLHAGTSEEMAEQAARLYMAEWAEGVETSLNARSHAEADDLNRRVQAYMREYKLTRGPAVRLSDQTRAQAGDVIFARENDNRTHADGTRTVSNGHIMRIEEVSGPQVAVRRLTGHDKETGRRQWSQPYMLSRLYLRDNAALGYALTTQIAQGATTWSGINFGSDARSSGDLYSGLHRGRIRNHAFVYNTEPACESGKEAEGAPELARYAAMVAERDSTMRMPAQSEHDPVEMLTPVVRRDAVSLSATETRAKNLAAADHMGILWQMRQDAGRQATGRRYEQTVREQLSEDQAAGVLRDTDDLFRSLRWAELADVPAADALRAAIAQRPLGDAASVAAVLAHRVRGLTEKITPVHTGLKDLGDAELADFAARTDKAMAAREERIGAHTAKTAPQWAVKALGAAPDNEQARREWEAKAGGLGGFREITGFESQKSVIGPEPPTTFPELRAEWHRVSKILADVEHDRTRTLTEGQLRAQREAALRDTAWLPPDVSREMEVANSTAAEYRTAAMHHGLRCGAARLARDPDLERFHREQAIAARAKAERAASVAKILEPVHETRKQADLLRADGWRVGGEAHRELHRRGVLLAEEREFSSREKPAFDCAALRAAQKQAADRAAVEAAENKAEPPARAEPASEQPQPVPQPGEPEAETEAQAAGAAREPEPQPEREAEAAAAGTDLTEVQAQNAAPPGAEQEPDQPAVAERESSEGREAVAEAESKVPELRGEAPAAEPTVEQVRVMLGLDEEHILEEDAGRLEHIIAAARAAQEKVDLEATTLEPAGEEGELSPAQAWSRETGRTREAVLYDPEPELGPAPEVQKEADARDFEAAG